MENLVPALRNTIPISLFNKGMAGKIFKSVKENGSKVVMKNNVPECVLMSPESYLAMTENWKTLNCLHSRCIGSRMGLFRRPKTGMKYEKNLGSHPKILRMLMMLRWNLNDMACSFFHFCRKGLEKL